MPKTNTDAICELEQLVATIKQQIAAMESNVTRIEGRLNEWGNKIWTAVVIVFTSMLAAFVSIAIALFRH